ncbi:hypothetical protein HPB48_020832 [Haemaphysalis longicornis]|uniref:Uncharacterized protein n=1 Tax=Haemaphysalis longicornis TaxID=44386 RepID=A0A9J6GL98_HAELO|nr:hypothetical protein HPB48_020832 [Haemaphysalis longicornis]
MSEFTGQIAGPTKNGQSLPSTESRKSSQSVNIPGVRARRNQRSASQTVGHKSIACSVSPLGLPLRLRPLAGAKFDRHSTPWCSLVLPLAVLDDEFKEASELIDSDRERLFLSDCGYYSSEKLDSAATISSRARGATPWPLPPVRTSLGESSTKPGESGTKYKAVASTEPADEPSRSTLKNVLATDTAAIEDGIRVDSTTIAAGPTQTESAMPTAPRVADAAASARPLTKPRTAEDEAFLSPERSAPEQASVYVTATEAGGVRGLFQKLRGKLQEAGASLGKEILPRNKAGRDAADEKEEMAGQSKVQLPAQATPPKPTGIANTEGQSCAASDELNIDVVAEAIHASTRYVAESVDIAAAQGIDVLPSRSRGAKFVYPDKELHRTPSKFADWPKHEAEIIPDPECVLSRTT